MRISDWSSDVCSSDLLAMRGFAAEGAGSARELRTALKGSEPPAIIILDIGLPDGNGFDLAREIRGSLDCGIIMLTALGEADDRVRGFDSGADIYLVKHSRSEEHTSELQSLMRLSYAVFCLKKKKKYK